MLVFDWLEQTDKINWVDPEYFACKNDLCRAMLPDCLGTLSSTLCQISALKEAFSQYVYDNTIFLKWGILNVPFCSMFVPFHFYRIMTLVVPCLDNIFMVLLISALENFKIVATKPFFSDSVSLGEGVRACVVMVCYHCIVHILNSSKKLYFLCL